MQAIIALLRGVNVGGHNQIKMDTLRSLCGALKLENAETYLQSGNVVFATKERNLTSLQKGLEDAIQKELGFRPAVIARTASEMREVIARNPFSRRKGVEPAKLAVIFFVETIAPEIRKQVEAIKVGHDEIHAFERELYIYFPEGMGKSKLPAAIERIMKKTGTARNWNSVTKLLEMAEKMEAANCA